jgi:hypothetical protein
MQYMIKFVYNGGCYTLHTIVSVFGHYTTGTVCANIDQTYVKTQKEGNNIMQEIRHMAGTDL